jgi:cytochrome c
MLRRWALLLALALVGGCERDDVPARLRVVGGDPEVGRVLIANHGCSACHRIPGIDQASGRVGPPLEGFGRRAYIAGRLPNRPAMLTMWVRDPTAIDPRTAMPAVGLSESEARHVAAYLYTLR